MGKSLNHKTLLILIALTPLALEAQAPPANALLHRGNGRYNEKKYDEALSLYDQVLQSNPNDPVAWYNKANVLFRKSDFKGAEAAYEQVLQLKAASSLQQKAWYNKGVTFSAEKKLDESIAAYEKALILDPTDEDARFNLQKALEEKRRQQKQDKSSNNQQKKKDKKQSPQPSSPNKRMLEQWLQALRQKEQEVQKKMQENRSRSVTQPQKDW